MKLRSHGRASPVQDQPPISSSKKTITKKRSNKKPVKKSMATKNTRTFSKPVSIMGAKKSDARCVDNLPDHVLVSVFQALRITDRIRVERVCRRWHRLAKHHSWSRLKSFCYGTLTYSDSAYRRVSFSNKHTRALLSRCGAHLERLDLSGFRDTLSYSVVGSMCKFCTNLTHLGLTGIQLTNSALRSLGEHCPKLQLVHLQRCFQNSVVETGLGCFLANCQQLRVLDVSENERLRGWPSFGHLPGTLRALNVSGCFEMNDDAARAVATRCSELESLSMDDVDGVGHIGLSQLFSAMTKLKTLRFGEYFYGPPQDAHLGALGQMGQIRELNLSDNMLITDFAVTAVADGCKQLESLDISGCNQSITDEGISSLSRLPSLLRLNISLLRRVTDEGVRQLARPGKLEVLLLHRCDEVTDAALLHLAACCQKLKKLDVSYCGRITDVSVWAFYHLVEKRQERLNMWLGRTGATLNPPAVVHPLLDLNVHDYVFDHSSVVTPLLNDTW